MKSRLLNQFSDEQLKGLKLIGACVALGTCGIRQLYEALNPHTPSLSELTEELAELRGRKPANKPEHGYYRQFVRRDKRQIYKG